MGRWRRSLPWIAVGALLLLALGAALLLYGWADILSLVRGLAEPETLRAAVARLSWGGPLALIFFNAAQIVVAPVPGYAIFAAAGWLYGPLWGGLYGTMGTLLGAAAAMLLVRRFGRPMAERMVGAERIDRWASMTVSRSSAAWTLLLLAPVGDLPFFIAGLSQMAVGRILLLTIITRVPTIFLITATASGSAGLSWELLVLLILAMLIGFGVLFRYQERMVAWVERRIRQQPAWEQPPSDE